MNNSRNFAQSQAGLLLAKGTIISISVVSILTSDISSAQITPDTTLGNQSSHVTTGINIQESEVDLIEGGVQRGSSLFHSFTEFNVNNGQRVYFANPTGIADIFSRVTGSNASHILGTLGVNGTANLYLLNPKGIIFGTNARLDIQGSLFATTADSFQFPDGSEFSATNPQMPPLLTMSVMMGVQYGSQQTASITNQGNLETGKNLTLSAGSLDLQGRLETGGDLILQGQDTLKVRDSASNPLIVSAGGNLLAQGNQKVDILALNNPNSGFFSGGNMVLRSSNTVDGNAHYWAGGNFRIEQLNGDLGNLFSPDDPVIRATGDVSFGSYTGASLHILAGGSVNISGNVEITGADSTSNSLKETVTLSDGTTKIYIDGSAIPTLDIRAGVNSNYIGTSGFTTNEPTNANITIQGSIYNLSGYQSNSGQILITNQYNPNKLPGNITTQAIPTYGDVTIDSRGDITTNGGIDTTTARSGENNKGAGNIRLLANKNIFIYGNLLSSFYPVNNNVTGYSGSIIINAKDQIFILNGSKISSQGSSGYINIKTGSLSLDQKSEIDTNNGSGDAGFIIIDAKDQISILNGSKISSNGNSGLIYIKAGSLSLNQKSEIDTNNNSSVDRGYISVDDIDQISMLNSREIATKAKEYAGFIIVNASDQISILNGSKISSNGNYGNINITTQNLLLRRQSKISTTAGKEGFGGNGGSITIDATGGFIVAVPSEDSDIIANAFGGQGGKINISANRTLGFQNRENLSSEQLKRIENNGSSDISASSDVGDDGEVAIETLSIDPSQGLVELPTDLVDPSRLIAQSCGSGNSNVAKGQSEFVITGRGGLPPSPDDTFKSGVSLPEWVVKDTSNASNSSENITVKEMNLRQLSSNTSTPLVEAVGMVRSVNGDIVLTTQPTVPTPLQSGLSSKVCGLVQGNVRE